jgi:hypothetical protein
MFLLPHEALAFFNRLVDGIGLLNTADVADLTRTAAVVRTREAEDSEQYTIKYLSFYSGLALDFNKPEHMLTGVELLVTWSLQDIKNTYGDKFKRRTVAGRKVLDYGRLATGHLLVASLDDNGNVRSVRLTKPK